MTTINNILFTGFVDTDVPYNAIDYVSANYDNIRMMCTTDILHLDTVPESKVVSLLMGHVGFLNSYQDRIKNNDIEAVCIPQDVYAQLLDSGNRCMYSSSGLGSFIEYKKGNLTPFKINTSFVTPMSRMNRILYQLPYDDIIGVVLVDTYDPSSGNIILGGEMILDRMAALTHCDKLILGCYNIASVSDSESDLKVYNVIAHVSEEKRPVEDSTTQFDINSNMDYIASVMELVEGNVVNVGVGYTPEMCASVLNPDYYTFTVEAGCIGGIPNSGKRFGTAKHPRQIISHGEMFKMYEDGFIDTAILGVGQFTIDGKISVHKTKDKVVGTGGFIGITNNAKVVIFCASEKKLVDNLDEWTYDCTRKQDGQKRYIVTEKRVIKF